jgi:hypothetical protein
MPENVGVGRYAGYQIATHRRGNDTKCASSLPLPNGADRLLSNTDCRSANAYGSGGQ